MEARECFSLIGLSAALSGCVTTSIREQTPEFVARPNGDQLASLFPERAQRMEVSGSAVVQCQAQPGGDLADCQVVRERPGGYAFGEATLRAARYFKLKPL